MSFLYLAIHYPKKEHRNDLLTAMLRLDQEMHGVSGLRHIGAWSDESEDRIIALSIWESREAFKAGLEMIGRVASHVPFDQWEVRPRELIRADEIEFTK